MYPNYPHDPVDQHYDTASRAIEGDQYHLRIQRGTVTLSLTANTELDTTVNFANPFSATPTVHPTLSSVGTISAKINIVASSPSNTGFTLKAYSDTTQSITVQYIAVGSAQ